MLFTGKIMSLSQKIAGFVPKLSVSVAGMTLCLMGGLVLAEVIARNLFNYGLTERIIVLSFLKASPALYSKTSPFVSISSC